MSRGLAALVAGLTMALQWPAAFASTTPDGVRTVFNPGTNGAVWEVIAQSDGGILVGGIFSQVNGQARSKLARLDSNGVLDPLYNPSVSTSGIDQVFSGFVQPDGKSVFAGRFTAVGGPARDSIVRLNADGSVDTTFVASILGSSRTAEVITLQPDGKILIGGVFTTVNGTARRNLARVNADGTLDTSFDAGTGPDNRVYGIVVQPDGKVVVTGGFVAVNNQVSRGLARLNADGSFDATFLPVVTGGVREALVQADGRIIVVGSMTDISGTPRNGIARLNPDGSVDPAFNPNINGSLFVIKAQPDGKLLVSGSFTQVGGVARTNIARLNADGSLDTSFGDSLANARITTLAMQADGKVVIGGSFSQVGGYPRANIARLKANGLLDLDAFTVTPVAGPNGTITPDTPQSVNESETTAFTLTPAAGFGIASVTGCGGTLDGVTYTTGAIVADCTVSATFVSGTVSYTVTPVAGAHGALVPGTPQSVEQGQTTSFTVAPDTDYYLDEITGCDGQLAGTAYTTGAILADCAVIASFTTPTALSATGGTPQVTAVNTPFLAPLTIRVTDAENQPIAGVAVSFAAPAAGAGAVLSAVTAVTNANGEASVTARANGNGGNYVVTASAHGFTVEFALANEAIDHGGIDLRVTVSRDPAPACGTTNAIAVVAGEQLNYCFTVTNNTGVTLRYHTLGFAPLDAGYEPYNKNIFFYLMEQPIPPGGSFQYNRLITAGTSAQQPKFIWSAVASMPRYAVSDSTSVPFVDISTFGHALPLVSYSTYNLTDLPFPIHHYGRVFLNDGVDRLCISNSGTLRPHRGQCPTIQFLIVPPFLGDNQSLSALSPDGHDGILPYWDLLGDNGMVYHATLGDAPNRRLIVQWHRKDHLSRPNPDNGITFQAVLDEATGAISFVYQDLTFNSVDTGLDYGGSATVGLTNLTRAIRQQYSLNAAVLAEGGAIVWQPTDITHYDTAQVRIDVGAPRLVLSATVLEASAVTGAITQRGIGIGNAGDLDLQWTLDQASSRAHFPPPGPRYLQAPDLERSDVPAPPAAGTAFAAHAPTEQPQTVFAIPAYGMKHEGTDSGQPMYPVSFDAAGPQQFVHTTGPRAYGDIYGGDFINDDFSRMYVFDGYRDSDFSYSTLDVTTGDYSNITFGEPVVPENGFEWPFPRWSGLAWDGSTSTLYASTAGGGAYCQSASASDLYTVRVATGTPTRVGAIDIGGPPVCVTDIAVAPNGAMYGVDIHNNALLAIDKASGAAAIIGSLGFDAIYTNSIDFDDVTGVLYLAAYQDEATGVGGLFTVNLTTGMASRVSLFPELVDHASYLTIKGMAIARAGGRCAHPGEIPWLSTDVIEGVTAPNGEAAVTVTLAATDLVPGRYEANLCVHSNDRSQPQRSLAIGFTVTEVEVIFTDGFDDATP